VYSNPSAARAVFADANAAQPAPSSIGIVINHSSWPDIITTVDDGKRK
jgi:hypothetical protein